MLQAISQFRKSWRRGTVGVVVLISSVMCGCKMASPILLQPPSAKKVDVEFPCKIGVNSVQKAGGSRISNVGLYIFPAVFFEGKMPRRTETDYVLQSIADHLNDYSMFKYAYIQPYDPEKVQLVLEMSFEEYDCNSYMDGTYGTLINLPYISLLQLVGVPQDIFESTIKCTCTLKTPAGVEIATYSYEADASEGVTIYKMPYGNYLWYESIFRREFDSMMQSFYAQMRKDRDRVMAAVR